MTHPANPPEPPGPPAVDISSEAIRQNVEFLRTGFHIHHGFFADALEALAADRDRLAKAWAEASASLETTSGYLASARTPLSAQVEAAREALAPFAVYTEAAFPEIVYRPDDNALSHHRGRNDWLHVTVADFRRARAAHAKLAEGA